MRTTNSVGTRSIPLVPSRMSGISSGILGAVLISLAMLSALFLPAITRPSAVLMLGGVAALFSVAALAGLVHLVLTDVRDAIDAARSASGRESTA